MTDQPALYNFEIFPHLMVRYASGHHAEFEHLRYPDIDKINSDLNNREAEIQRLKDIICDYLYQSVSRTPSITEKQFLIGIKRDIFNGRELTPAIRESFIKSLPEDQKLEFGRYFSLKKELKEYNSECQKRYDVHLSEQRLLLQKLSQNELFKKGIRLSSKILFDQLVSFAKAPANSFSSKEFRQEYSLLRYLTRMFFKTSPFSTFTYLGIGNLTDEHLLKLPNPNIVNSHIRLNNEIFSYLTIMLTLNSEINEQLFVNVNPTIEIHGENLSFMVNFRNLESFQKTRNTPVLQALLQIRNEHASPLRLKQMVGKLTEVVDSSEQAIKAYLLKLIEIGFLEFDFQTSGVSPDWNDKLLKNLKAIQKPGPLLLETIKILSQQGDNCRQYGQAGLYERGVVLDSMFDQLSILYAQLMKSLGLDELDKKTYLQEYKAAFDTNKFKKHPYIMPTLSTETLIYEDCFTKSLTEVSHEAMKEIVASVNEICDFLEPLDGSRVERNRMTSFFIKQYGKDMDVPVLDFYREYYSQVKTPHSQSSESGNNNSDPHQEAFNHVYNEWVGCLKELLTGINANDEEIALDKKIIQKVSLPTKKNAGRVSRAMFAQCFLQKGNLRAVVNNVFLGMGRASGRFLHLFDHSITEELKVFNNQMFPGDLLMELSDGSYFNANIHPPLLPFELSIPDGHNSLPHSAQIPVKDVLIYFDISEEQIFLRHRVTGQRIFPFDLCLQSLSQRSKLYQLLAHFSSDQSVSFLPIQRAIQQVIFQDSDGSGKREIYYFPRIVYQEKIILKRKSWSVLTSSVPKKADQQSDAEYFFVINQWRAKNGFPQQVFLYLKPRSSENANPSDDYKPQYIRFDTPLLVLLWCRLLKKAEEYIYFEEMMPDTEVLKENPVNEFLVQWYMK